MTGNGETEPAASKSASFGWQAARLRMMQLETAAKRMSPRWFAGHSGIIAAAALSVLTAIVLGFSLMRMQATYEEAQRAQDALLESMTLQEALDDSSVSARGYAITHDASLLAVRKVALESVDRSITRLNSLVRPDAPSRPLLDDIRTAVFKRLQNFDSLTSVGTARNAAGRVQAGETQRVQLVRHSTDAISAFRASQTAQLRELQDRVRQTMQFSVILVLFAGFAAPLFGAFGMRMLRRAQEDQHTHELQTELMHVQRLAIMGDTSATLAHEINQPLSAALNYLAVMRRHLDAGATDKAQTMADRLQQQIQRAGNILNKLRRFIEKRETERSMETPETLVEDAITLLGTIDGTVELKTEIGQQLPRVLVDRVQMQQVLVNLMRNAIEAMQDSPRRELHLSVVAIERGMIQISLADTGPGLTAEVAGSLFKPFVSTKSGGMGVGLSICRRIVSSHGGRIWAEPDQAGAGAVFHFTLPAAEERVAA